MNKVRLLTVLVVIEAVIIVVILMNRFKVKVEPVISLETVPQNPLALALEYESPEKKFEEVVAKNAGWIDHRSPLSGQPVLADCAVARKTNFARILIAHGADVETAIKSLENSNADTAISLLCQLNAEAGKQE